MVHRRTTPTATGASSKPRGKTRLRLLDTGLRLFAEKGPDGVTVSELEESVGLKPGNGSFYRHFADKQALLEAIMEREIERAQARRAREQDAVKDAGTDIREALARQFRMTLAGLRENAQVINLLARCNDHFPVLMAELRDAFVQQATDTVAASYADRVRRGDMLAADPALLSSVVQSALYGYFSAENLFGMPQDRAAFDAAFVDTLVSMATGRPAG